MVENEHGRIVTLDTSDAIFMFINPWRHNNPLLETRILFLNSLVLKTKNVIIKYN